MIDNSNRKGPTNRVEAGRTKINLKKTATGASYFYRAAINNLINQTKPFAGLLLLVMCVITGFGQNARNTDYSPDKTLKSNARVNPSTLAMEMSVPIAGYPGRAGNSLPISFDYSSKVWEIMTNDTIPTTYGPRTNTSAIYAKRTAAGWSSNLGAPRIDYNYDNYDGSDNPATGGGGYIGQVHSDAEQNFPTNLYYVKRLRVEMPDGSSHELRVDDSVINCGDTSTGCASDFTGTFLAVDGSKMRLERSSSGTAVLYLPNGNFYSFEPVDATLDLKGHQARSFTDRHGNKMTYNPASGQWTDTLGRVIANPLPVNWNGIQSQTVGDVATSFPGLGTGTISATFSWRYLKDPNGGESGLNDPSQTLHSISSTGCQGNATRDIPAPYLFSTIEPYKLRVCGPISFSGINNWTPGPPFNPVVLTKITLANGQAYQFKYNVYGEIEKIIYPSGGYERFAYDRMPAVQASSGTFEQANRGVTDRWVSASGDGTDERHWTYAAVRGTLLAPAPYKVTTTNPDGTRSEQLLHDEPNRNVERPYGFDNQRTGRPYETRVYSASNQLLRRTLTAYEVTETSTGAAAGASVQATRDIRPAKEISITFEPGAASALSMMSETNYDTNSDPAYFAQLNPKTAKAYHYVAVGLTTAQTADISTISALFSNSNLAQTSETDYLYDASYKVRNIVTLPTETRVKDAAGNVAAKSQVSYDESAYGILSAGTDAMWTDPSTTYRGNPTTSRSWTDIAANNYVETHAQFDNFGNARKAWDARGNLSEVEFSSAYKYAYPTKTISTAPDPSGQNGSSTAFETTSVYDLTTGLVTSTTDANGQTSQMEYNDSLLRPTKVIPPAGGAQTVMEYTDTPGAMKVKTKTQIDGTNWAESIVYADGLGRSVKTEKKDDAGNVFAETEYDLMGRVKKATNPYRAGETKLWTENTYDDLSRVTKVKTPDNAEVNLAFGLSTSGKIGMLKTVTDQAGKKRSGISDALGRMIRVIEDPTGQNLSTDYVFDTLGNLRETVQGDQHRYFMYDSIGRILRAKQPEQDANASLAVTDPVTGNGSWSVGYIYDNNGNITSTTDARGITVTGTYDNLNRLKLRDYSDSTPDVNFYYDGRGLASVPTNSKGKITKVSSSVSETNYLTFDNLGRIKSSRQITNGQTYNFSDYAYDLAGNLISQTYPSGRIVNNQIGADGSLTSVSGQMNSASKTYANNLAYTAAGAVKQMQLGNGRWENAAFNNRLQVTQIGLGTTATAQDLLKLDYDYGNSATNNGSLQSQQITVPTVGANSGFTASQSYGYDALNRLTSATETAASNQTWKQTFTYDRYGNRRFDAANTTTIGQSNSITNPTIDTANNRLTANQGYTYDAGGNLTQDAEGKQFAYDAENYQQSFGTNNSNSNGGQYFYDGVGNRVKKIIGQIETISVYNAVNQLIAEYSNEVVQSTNSTNYLTSDHLGSPRVITDQTGNVISRHDYTSFGEEAVTNQRTSALGYTPDHIKQKYTGYERDAESGLDYAQARYYNSKHGRFTSVDPLTASATINDPQTLNRYSYTLNSPYKFTDPFGLMAGGSGFCSAQFSSCEKGTDGEVVRIDLNIVYDKNQYDRKSAEDATRKTIQDAQSTFGNINIEFNVTYAAGEGDPNSINTDNGVYSRISTGAKEGAINVFLFANNKYHGGRDGSFYSPSSRQIFMWEGSSDTNPKARNVYYRLSATALAHEMGHLFLHMAGEPISESLRYNITSDIRIDSSNNNMRYNPFFTPPRDLPNDFNYKEDVKIDIVGGKGWEGTRRSPSAIQLYRFGAKQIAAQKK